MLNSVHLVCHLNIEQILDLLMYIMLWALGPNYFTYTAHLYLYYTLLVPHTYASYIRHWCIFSHYEIQYKSFRISNTFNTMGNTDAVASCIAYWERLSSSLMDAPIWLSLELMMWFWCQIEDFRKLINQVECAWWLLDLV